MDHLADSPLNKVNVFFDRKKLVSRKNNTAFKLLQAHFYDRRASAYAKKFQFDEAIECHSAACQELDKTYKLTTNSKAIESIALQHKYHKRQKDFLRYEPFKPFNFLDFSQS